MESENSAYRVVMSVNKGNLFEIVEESSKGKYLARVYDCDDLCKFQNEVEKLEILNSIMEDMGVAKQGGFVVKMIESFSCEISSGMQVLCIVMESLGMSLATYLSSIETSQAVEVPGLLSMEYSESESEVVSCLERQSLASNKRQGNKVLS